MSLSAAGAFFFWTGLFSAASQLAAPAVARRIGLINTMVFTHIPANLCLIAAAFASSLHVALGLLLARSALSQMDVPARSAYVMSVVTPAERPAAASFTAVPRSLASAVSPSLTGAMFAAGAMAAPLVACGVLKIAYDLALFSAFRRVGPRPSVIADAFRQGAQGGGGEGRRSCSGAADSSIPGLCCTAIAYQHIAALPTCRTWMDGAAAVIGPAAHRHRLGPRALPLDQESVGDIGMRAQRKSRGTLLLSCRFNAEGSAR